MHHVIEHKFPLVLDVNHMNNDTYYRCKLFIYIDVGCQLNIFFEQIVFRPYFAVLTTPVANDETPWSMAEASFETQEEKSLKTPII